MFILMTIKNYLIIYILKKDEIEDEIGISLNWKRLDDKKASKIEIDHENIDTLNKDNWENMIETHIEDAKKLYYVFKDRVKEYVNEE